MRKKLTSLLLAGSLSLGLATGAGAVSVQDFKDVNTSDWYYKAVNHVTHFGYFNGTSSTEFSPNEGMSRGMVVTVLARCIAKDLDSYAAQTKFTDVSQDVYYAKAVNWAVSKGVTKGISETTFAPNDLVTREQIATFLYRAANSKDSTSISFQEYLEKYSDKDTVSEWAKELIGWASAFGIISGIDGKLEPQGTTSRAMFAQILQNYDTYRGVSMDDDSAEPSVPTPPPTPDQKPSTVPTPLPTPSTPDTKPSTPSTAPTPGTDDSDTRTQEEEIQRGVAELLIDEWKGTGEELATLNENLTQAARKMAYQEATDPLEAVASTGFDKPLGKVYVDKYMVEDYDVLAFTASARTAEEAMQMLRKNSDILMNPVWFTEFGVGCKVNAGLVSKHTVTVLAYRGNPHGDIQISQMQEDWIASQKDKPYTLDAYEQEVVTRLNQIRRQYGLKEFSTCADMQEIARARAQEMKQMLDNKSNRDNIHLRPDGRSCLSIYDEYGHYPYYKDPYTGMDGYVGHAAENAGSAVHTPEEIVTGWMNSPKHKAIILDDDFDYIGIGYAPRVYNGKPSGYYWALELLSAH